MRNYEIEQEMYRRAAELIETRYPTGWGGAGIVHTSKGNFYTSVCIETANASAVLCIETGAMLEAHKFNEKVTPCVLSAKMKILRIRCSLRAAFVRSG